MSRVQSGALWSLCVSVLAALLLQGCCQERPVCDNVPACEPACTGSRVCVAGRCVMPDGGAQPDVHPGPDQAVSLPDTLQPPPTTLRIVSSNIAALAGQKGARTLSTLSGPLTVRFNYPVDVKKTVITLMDELGKKTAKPPVLTGSKDRLTIHFSELKSGFEYNITIRAFGSGAGAHLSGSFGAPFFTPAIAGSVVIVLLQRDTSKKGRLRAVFSEPVGTGYPGKSLSGEDGVLFFAYDLNGSGKVGDYPGERGMLTTPHALEIEEVDPPGPAGLSGYSRYWTFTLPKDKFLGTYLPAGTPVDMLFDYTVHSVKRVDNASLPSMFNLTVPN